MRHTMLLPKIQSKVLFVSYLSSFSPVYSTYNPGFKSLTALLHTNFTKALSITNFYKVYHRCKNYQVYLHFQPVAHTADIDDIPIIHFYILFIFKLLTVYICSVS